MGPLANKNQFEKVNRLPTTIDEVSVRPDGPLPWRRDKPDSCLAAEQVLTDVARLGDGVSTSDTGTT
jgi:hypothetical protein